MTSLPSFRLPLLGLRFAGSLVARSRADVFRLPDGLPRLATA